MQGAFEGIGNAHVVFEHEGGIVGVIVGPRKFCHEVALTKFVGQRVTVFLAANVVVDPNFVRRIEAVAFAISAIEPLGINGIADFISIDDPDGESAELLLFEPIDAEYGWFRMCKSNGRYGQEHQGRDDQKMFAIPNKRYSHYNGIRKNTTFDKGG